MKINRESFANEVNDIVMEAISNGDEFDTTTGKVMTLFWPVIQYLKDQCPDPWIKLKDRKPKRGQQILTVNMDNGIKDWFNPYVMTYWNDLSQPKFTHWQTIEKPKT